MGSARRLPVARTVVLVLGVGLAGCGQPPAQRQASRQPTGRADAIVAAVGHEPARATVTVDSIRDEYSARGVVGPRDPAIDQSDDLVLVVEASPDVIADLRVGDDVVLVRADGSGGVEAGTIEALPEADAADSRRVAIASPVTERADAPVGTRFAVTLFGQPVEGSAVPHEALRQERDQQFVVVEALDGSRRRVDVDVLARSAVAVAVAGDIVPGDVVVL